MISYAVYKIIHLTGIMMVFLALGGLSTHAINGGDKKHSWRLPIALTHGIGMTLSLVAGFGLLARLGIAQGGLPGWAIAKLVIWAIFGGLMALIIRQPKLSRSLWFIMIALGALAAYLAGAKPW